MLPDDLEDISLTPPTIEVQCATWFTCAVHKILRITIVVQCATWFTCATCAVPNVKSKTFQSPTTIWLNAMRNLIYLCRALLLCSARSNSFPHYADSSAPHFQIFVHAPSSARPNRFPRYADRMRYMYSSAPHFQIFVHVASWPRIHLVDTADHNWSAISYLVHLVMQNGKSKTLRSHRPQFN